jgi:hypothetical protein
MESSAVSKLFDSLRCRVTAADIRDFSPGDPGYVGYVSCWLRILETGDLPRMPEFNVTEVLGLNCGVNPKSEPPRFCTYRLFISTVACRLFLAGHDSENIQPANFTALRLVNDVHELAEIELSALVGAVLREVPEFLKEREWLEDEYPFFHAAEMVWAQRAGDFERSRDAAIALMQSDYRVRQHLDFSSDDARFLYGLSVYDCHYKEWRRTFSKLVNPNGSEHLQLVLETLNDA